jgi:hypothetical protein
VKNILLFCLAVLLALPNLVKKDIHDTPVYNGVELFEPQLGRLGSLNELERYTDSIATAQGISAKDTGYLLLLEDVIKRRFYHGYSHHPLHQNWVAAVSEYIFGLALSCTVYSNDILQYPHAACSQQVIVLMDILKRKGIAHRSVTFQHHYALEAMHNNQWYLFDPNMEPNIPWHHRSHHLWANNTDYLKPFYPARYSAAQLDYIFGNGKPATCGSINKKLAPNAKIFQTATGIVSHWSWLLPLALLLVRRTKTNAFTTDRAKPSIG